jgi:hypothetical protein
LLCPCAPSLNDEDLFPPQPAIFVGGSDGDAGRLHCLRLGAACADGDPDGVLPLWTSEYEAPVFALAASAPAAVATVAADAPDTPPTTTLLAVAAGSIVFLHDAASGAVLRRLVAGDGPWITQCRRSPLHGVPSSH